MLPQFFKDMISQFFLDINGIHGVEHWVRVYKNGFQLAERNGASKRVILYFAFLHDCQRISDHSDANHGYRAALYAKENRHRIDLDDQEFKLLLEALASHTRGCGCNSDITVKTCLDADRLDIGRIGVYVDPSQLFTEEGIDKAQSIRKWRVMEKS